MSRDIRSYFTTLSKKPSSSTGTPITKKKTKRPIIIDSDDEDIIPGTPESTKKLKLSASDTKKKLKPKAFDLATKEIKTKLVELQKLIVSDSDDEYKVEQVDPKDVFGTSPVRQSKPSNEEARNRRDMEFKKTLRHLETDDFDIDVGELDKTIDEAVRHGPKKQDNAEERYERRRHNAMLYQNYVHRPGPSNKGVKEWPKGKADCLKNICFLRTGVLDSLDLEDFKNIVVEHGGRTVSSVSKNVNYIVVGEGPGPAKLERARKLGIREISEDQLLDMILVKSNMKPRYVKKEGEEDDVEEVGRNESETSSRETTGKRKRSRSRSQDRERKKLKEESKNDEEKKSSEESVMNDAKTSIKAENNSIRDCKADEYDRKADKVTHKSNRCKTDNIDHKENDKVDEVDCKVEKDDCKIDKEDCKVEKDDYKADKKDHRAEKDDRKREKDDRKREKDYRSRQEKEEHRREKGDRKEGKDDRRQEKDRKTEKDDHKTDKDDRRQEKKDRRQEKEDHRQEKEDRKLKKDDRRSDKHDKEDRKTEKRDSKSGGHSHRDEKEERKQEKDNRKSDKSEKEHRKSDEAKLHSSDDKDDAKDRKLNIGNKYANAIKEEIRQIKEGVPSTSSYKSEATQLKPKETPQCNLSWTEKYKPVNLKSIIGQQGDKSNMSKLLNWLKNWYRNHSPHNKTKMMRPSPWAKNDDGAFFKCALLSGPPGVGKTTTSTLVARELEFDVVEFNASDTRSKKFLHERVAQMLKTKSVASYFKDGAGDAPTSKHVLLMDEVDGMAGNEDRGGIQELINLIKNSKIPIICMCNDRQHQKMRSLVNYCYDLRFSKPRVEQIKGAMMSICYKEGLKIDSEALSELIGNSGSDIRQTLNNLSMWSSGNKNLSSDMVKKESAVAIKDTVLGPWEVIKKVFSYEEHKKMSLVDRSRLFFYDYSIGPLFVQENYLQVEPRDRNETLDRVAKAADSISMGDVIDKKIRSTNNWSLLESQAFYSSVIPGHYMEGHFTGQINFPSWLGKNSKRTKFNRLLGELQAHTRTAASSSKASLNLDYIYHLRDRIVGPLAKERTEGVTKALDVMRAYHLMREDLDSLLELAQWPTRADPMAMVDSKVKAAFTRAYNKEGVTLPYSVTSVAIKKSSRDSEDMYGDEEAVSDDGDDDDISKDGMIKEKKPSKAAASKKAPAKKDAAPKKPSARGGRGGRKGK